MPADRSFARLAGILALVAAPLSWLSLAIGLLAVGGDFDAFGDPARLFALGEPAAAQIQWSYWLSMLGSYLLLLPLVIWLHANLARRAPLHARWYALCGLGYLVLGGAGAAILASTWPFLIRAAAEPGAAPDQLALLFRFSTAIAESGLQGLIQNLAGGVWWLGLGLLLWPARRPFAGLSLAIGGALLLTALGGLLRVEALSALGLIATLLLVPVWAIWAGLLALRTGDAL
jgi:hypothetical protein